MALGRKEQEGMPVAQANHHGSVSRGALFLWELPVSSGVFGSLSPFVCVLRFVIV